MWILCKKHTWEAWDIICAAYSADEADACVKAPQWWRRGGGFPK